MNKNFSSFLWLTPFIAFISGYAIIALLVGQKPFSMASYIGIPISHALIDISNKKLLAQVVKVKVDNDLPEGTILEQIPRAGNSVKHNQTVFFTLSTQESGSICPEYRGTVPKPHEGLSKKIYTFPSPTPEKVCFAQYPPAGIPLEKRTVICYCSQGENQLSIMPNYHGHSLKTLEEALDRLGYPYEITYTKSSLRTHDHKVTAQSPLAGTIITQSKPPRIKLIVD